MTRNSAPFKKTTVDKKPPLCNSITNAESVSVGVPPAQYDCGKSSATATSGHTQEKCVRGMSKPDLITLWKLWSETDRRLDSLAQCVREGVQVDEASNFARWLRFSDILTLLQPHEQEVPLPIRATELRRKCEDLIYECGEWYRLHERSNTPRDAYISASQLAAIKDDLRAIKEALRLPLTATADTVDSAETGLRVLPGGAS
jgi:hypothetical protein